MRLPRRRIHAAFFSSLLLIRIAKGRLHSWSYSLVIDPFCGLLTNRHQEILVIVFLQQTIITNREPVFPYEKMLRDAPPTIATELFTFRLSMIAVRRASE